MRLNEAITIYLAAGASFGVYNLLRQRTSGSRFHALLRATRAAIFWPLAAATVLFSRQRQRTRRPTAEAERSRAEFNEKIARAERRQFAALQRVRQLTQAPSDAERARAERVFRTVHEMVEKYVGLTLAAAESDPNAPPSEREMELCRIAGRRGDDLVLAGRCVHRRNAVRLVAHQARSRTELLDALAEIRELVASEAASPLRSRVARHLSVATVRFYSCVFALLSLLEDETAARAVARLIDAECARLRRLEAQTTRESLAANEEETCKTHTLRPIIAGRSQLETSNQQG